MSKLKTFSHDVSKDVGIDPLLVVYIIIQIAKFIYDCKKEPKSLLSNARSPGPFDKLLIQSKIRRHLKGEAYNKYGRKIMDAIFFRAGQLTEVDIRDILDEVQEGEK